MQHYQAYKIHDMLTEKIMYSHDDLFFYRIEYTKGKFEKVPYKLIKTRKSKNKLTSLKVFVIQKCTKEFDSTEIVSTNPKTNEVSKRSCYKLLPTGKINHLEFIELLFELNGNAKILKLKTLADSFFDGYEYKTEKISD